MAPLSEPLRLFIARYITSVEKLEVLLLLSDHPDKTWSVDAVFRVIQSQPQSVAQRLQELTEEGFTQEQKGEYSYAPASPQLHEETQEIRRVYKERPTRIIEAIFSNPTKELRRFSDAFRFRKDT